MSAVMSNQAVSVDPHVCDEGPMFFQLQWTLTCMMNVSQWTFTYVMNVISEVRQWILTYVMKRS